MTDITAADVRELMRKYSGEPPDPPACSVCAKPMYVNQVSSEGFEFGCRCGHAIRSDDPYLFDPQVVALCRLALAVLEPGESELDLCEAWRLWEAATEEFVRSGLSTGKAVEDFNEWKQANGARCFVELISAQAELARLRAGNAELRGRKQ